MGEHLTGGIVQGLGVQDTAALVAAFGGGLTGGGGGCVCVRVGGGRGAWISDPVHWDQQEQRWPRLTFILM